MYKVLTRCLCEQSPVGPLALAGWRSCFWFCGTRECSPTGQRNYKTKVSKTWWRWQNDKKGIHKANMCHECFFFNIWKILKVTHTWTWQIHESEATVCTCKMSLCLCKVCINAALCDEVPGALVYSAILSLTDVSCKKKKIQLISSSNDFLEGRGEWS